jgi:glycerol-3-phosphate acyltransferase PlsY
MLILYALIAYLLGGILFALLFITRLIHKVDAGSIGAPWSFRLIILPGCVILWPLLLKKYLATIKDKT